MLAYSRGELTAPEEERIQELLVAYPELARALATPFPENDETVMADPQLDNEWQVLQRRLDEVTSVRPVATAFPARGFARAVAAIAAAVAIAAGAMLWRAEIRLSQPRVASDEQLLLPDGERGNGDASPILSPDGESYLLIAPLINQSYYADYRLEIVDATGTVPRVAWRSAALSRRSNDTFAIFVPRAFLKPGKYQVVLFGTGGGREERMASYTLRVPDSGK